MPLTINFECWIRSALNLMSTVRRRFESTDVQVDKVVLLTADSHNKWVLLFHWVDLQTQSTCPTAEATANAQGDIS